MQILQSAPADWVNADGKVVGEDNPADASADYSAWHKGRISTILIDGQRNNPTNHSTTMTNPDHAQKALAYDVAIGVCHLSADDWKALRIEADWRMWKGVDKDNPAWKYTRYFTDGTMKDVPNDKGMTGEASLYEWAHRIDEAKIPDGIEDHREGSLYLAARALV
ncbi:effector protein Tle3 domain-containing protein [Burkholderia ubonensis]|uniref:effector protein Tle3 domain-containing protein n=1 Tax=Burkholderia ubonensis TaxID=101571 RepID=UPI00358E5F40